uniref:NADH-ubiquinone oxidoreductase chain 2 n=1 Tax=Matsumurasca onukii TaxID=2912585 RepID=A0A343UNT8_MATON|nr:NADH dehydrogenase subunit 2 [Matsumurasca onukii]AVF91589.1 NADH dehydrogenase subunit 2 [Matsumurasca onukii]
MLMLIGLFLSISSNNWILIWCGLELVLICFVPMMLGLNFSSSECCLKYFIVQAVSSSILMLSVMMMLMDLDFYYEVIFNISLMIKMGVAPFHGWVLNVVEGLKFNFILIMLTILKLPPLYILSYISLYLFPFIFMGLLIGSVMGLNQNSLRKVLAYSSIFNMSFILSCLFFNYVWMFYLMFYSFILFMMVYSLIIFNLNYINQFVFNNFSIFNKFTLFINLLSMGGMPPLLGFLIKLFILELMLFMNFYFISFAMILMSLLIMFFYIRVTFITVMIFTFMSKLNLNLISTNSLILLNFNLIV